MSNDIIGNDGSIIKLIAIESDIETLQVEVEILNNHHHNYEKWLGKALEDGGYEIAGTTSPDFDGSYYKVDDLNAKSAYANKDGTGSLWWDGIDSWIVSASQGVLGTDYFKRTNASAIGAYTNEGSATGTVTGADIADEEHVADRMGPGISEFTLTAGNETWGPWIQILGADDTPIQVGKTKHDDHRVLVTDTTSTNPFIIQFITGESAGFAAKLLIEDFDEIPYKSATNNNDSGISDIINKRLDSGEKCWMRTCAIGANAPTLKLYIGIHEYVL